MFPDYSVTYVPGLYHRQPNERCSSYEGSFVKSMMKV
jgi:hypothetical protein